MRWVFSHGVRAGGSQLFRRLRLLLGLAVVAVGAGFVTSPAAAAIQVSVTSPLDGAHSLSGIVDVQINASADVGVFSVQLYVDGNPYGMPDLTTVTQYTYSIPWDTSTVAAGAHTLSALATESTDSATLASPTIAVDVGPAYPTVSLTSPSAWSFVRGTVALHADATSGVGPASVAFTLDGNPVTSPWDTTAVSDGSHTIQATVTDGRGKSATASSQVTVDNTKPSTSLLAPTANSYVTGSLPAQANASDAYGIVGVQYFIDGAAVGNALLTPDTPGGYTYSSNLSLSGLANGVHTLTDVATDNAGNTATSTPVAFTIGFAPLTAASITAPPGFTFASGTVTVAATATGGTGPFTAKLLVDGVVSALAPTVSGSAITFQWDATKMADGLHTLAVAVTDAKSATVTSPSVTVTVDRTPPSTYLIAPAAGSFYLGSLPAQAHASDAHGIATVQYLIDGKTVGAALTSPDTAGGFTYSSTLSLTGLANGAHTLTEVATDSAGNSATSAPVAFNIGAGPPTVAITAPASGGYARKTMTVTATVAGGTAPFTASLLVDGVASALTPTVAGSSITFQWDSTTVADGLHTLAVATTDQVGLKATSPTVNVTVDNAPPIAVMYQPAPLAGYAYARTNGPTTFQVHASAAYGVKSVQFTVDGAPVGALLTAPDAGQQYLYTVSFDTSTLTAGLHSVSAILTDNAGNVTTAVPVSVKTGPIVYVPVINWHGIEGPLDTQPDIYDQTAAEATAELSYLKTNGYQSITLAQYQTWLTSGTLPAGIVKPVLLTVDDGLTDELAWDPLLQTYGFKAVLFVVTGFADNKTPGANDPTGNMSWAQIKTLAGNGRWEIAFHAGLDGHGDYSDAGTSITLAAGQVESFSPTCFAYYNCLGTIATTTTTGSGKTKKTTTTTAAETPAQFEAQVTAEVAAGIAELKKQIPTANMSAWACPWNACGQWTTFYNDPSGTLQSWIPGHFASLFPIVFTQTDPITYGLASGTVGALNGDNRHYRFEVHTDTTTAQFATSLSDPAFGNN